MIWSNLTKLLIGFSLAIALLLGGGAVLAMYFLSKASTPPPKPIFANDTTNVKARPPALKTAAHQSVSPRPTSNGSTPTPKPLEPGAYRARITWPQGLVLRAEPNADAEHIGSAPYNQRIVVLQESPDKNWERVRLEDGEQEGWIKAGNTKPVQEAQ